ncbi:MAG: hypothetical protein HOH38_07955 [Nitrospinaceae bacterium]|nr:hypothetical protein [Nitrospina sp.]MBT5868756.1 hypothetical protein [Nitrospinaceae bacterium]
MMPELDINKLSIPKESGRKLDLILALHMGWKHWSGNELSAELHLDEWDEKNSNVSIPKFSTECDAFFEHVAAYFINLDMGFTANYLVSDQMWQVVIEVEGEKFSAKDYELPFAGSLAAICAIRKIKQS